MCDCEKVEMYLKRRFVCKINFELTLVNSTSVKIMKIPTFVFIVVLMQALSGVSVLPHHVNKAKIISIVSPGVDS